jgi:6-phosphogluconolactonase
MVFSRDGHMLYVLHELSGEVGQFAIDTKTGRLSPIGYSATVPAESGLRPGMPRAAIAAGAPPPPPPDPTPRIWAADLQITPDGRFLYATERTSSRIALLKVDKRDGRPSYVANVPTETQPRGIRISPDGRFLVATGEKSDMVAVYAIDRASGMLTPVGRAAGGKDANWVEIVDVR